MASKDDSGVDKGSKGEKEPSTLVEKGNDPFTHFKLEGQSLGYEGGALTSYIQERAREERAAAREKKERINGSFDFANSKRRKG